jgi:hypothetical protein
MVGGGEGWRRFRTNSCCKHRRNLEVEKDTDLNTPLQIEEEIA